MLGINLFKRKAEHLRLGEQGEKIAKRVLERCGLEYLTSNFRCNAGEIDLIFRDGNVLCFVEVKTRHRGLFAPETAVNYEKRRKLKRTALHYIRKHGLRKKQYRFDIVEVIFDGNNLSEVHHLKDKINN